MEEKGEITFTDYLAGEKPCGFYVSYTGAFFHKGLKVHYAYKSTAGINYVMARHNKYTFYNIYTFLKFRKGLNENY